MDRHIINLVLEGLDMGTNQLVTRMLFSGTAPGPRDSTLSPNQGIPQTYANAPENSKSPAHLLPPTEFLTFYQPTLSAWCPTEPPPAHSIQTKGLWVIDGDSDLH